MNRLLRLSLGFFITLLALWFFSGCFGARLSTMPNLVAVGPASQYFGSDYEVESLSLEASDKQKIAAWYLPNWVSGLIQSFQ